MPGNRYDEFVGSCRIKINQDTFHQFRQIGLPLPENQQSEESSNGRRKVVKICIKRNLVILREIIHDINYKIDLVIEFYSGT